MAVFLGIVSLSMNSRPVKAANNVKLYLNSNSYVYNNKGQRLRGKNNYLKKNKAVTAPGKLQKTNSVKRYYIMKDNSSTGVMNSKENLFNYLYWLPYKTIKKQEYYKIGYNRYIKCINVKSIYSEYLPSPYANKANELITNQATVVTKDPKTINQKHLVRMTMSPFSTVFSSISGVAVPMRMWPVVHTSSSRPTTMVPLNVSRILR